MIDNFFLYLYCYNENMNRFKNIRWLQSVFSVNWVVLCDQVFFLTAERISIRKTDSIEWITPCQSYSLPVNQDVSWRYGIIRLFSTKCILNSVWVQLHVTRYALGNVLIMENNCSRRNSVWFLFINVLV